MRDYSTVFEDMKDLQVHLLSEKSERLNDENAYLYEDIFIVIINTKIWFTFIPQFIFFDSKNLNSSIPDKLVKTKNDARLSCLFGYKYVITPNEVKKYTVEKVEYESYTDPEFVGLSNVPPEENFSILHYISDEEFTKFRDEYDSYFEIWHLNSDAIEEYKRIKNMIKYNFIDFIIKKIIITDSFSEEDYRWLLSGNK
jgi:hypothetical protein